MLIDVVLFIIGSEHVSKNIEKKNYELEIILYFSFPYGELKFSFLFTFTSFVVTLLFRDYTSWS